MTTGRMTVSITVILAVTVNTARRSARAPGYLPSALHLGCPRWRNEGGAENTHANSLLGHPRKRVDATAAVSQRFDNIIEQMMNHDLLETVLPGLIGTGRANV
ncbi:MAG: hypothetical protein ABSA31_02295 [Acidimicrobiales bacterium]